MASLIQKIGPIHLRARRVPVFQSLGQAIIYQQLSGKAAGTILARFLGLFGSGFPSPLSVAGGFLLVGRYSARETNQSDCTGAAPKF
jgi:3-methyladenine DNA glycosylase/8-oxoguanine DNA glycosylase